MPDASCTLRAGSSLQRLFSTFPDGWPGAGLLLLRVGAAISLIGFHAGGLANFDPSILLALHLAAAVGGILLLVGLWTPATGAAVAAAEIYSGFALRYSHPGEGWTHLLLVILSGAVAMLGPGAWSIDARLFGRKRLQIDAGGKSRLPQKEGSAPQPSRGRFPLDQG